MSNGVVALTAITRGKSLLFLEIRFFFWGGGVHGDEPPSIFRVFRAVYRDKIQVTYKVAKLNVSIVNTSRRIKKVEYNFCAFAQALWMSWCSEVSSLNPPSSTPPNRSTLRGHIVSLLKNHLQLPKHGSKRDVTYQNKRFVFVGN
jgi:hypothetical protein